MIGNGSTRLLQGVLLGGLYALFAAGLSLIFGVMRLVNIAHGDLIVLAAYSLMLAQALGLGIRSSRSLIVVPLMFALGYALQSRAAQPHARQRHPAAAAVTFGLSIIMQNGLLEVFSADTRRLHAGALESASIAARRRHRDRRDAADRLVVGGRASSLLLNALFYRTALGRAFRATSDDVETAQLMGINNKTIFALTMAHRARRLRRSPAYFLGARANFDPEHRPGAAALRLRGRHHRRPRQPLGHARRRHRRRRRADGRRAHQSRMADSLRPCRFPARAGDPAARPVSARGGLRAAACAGVS